jgi:hypothetical protein
MNIFALIVKAAIAIGIAYYLYSEQGLGAWLSAATGAVIFGLAYVMQWDGRGTFNGDQGTGGGDGG